jgi:adenylosuccinate lyase
VNAYAASHALCRGFTQWLERTLDDSAVRRLYLPQAFLATDAILRLVTNIAGGMTTNPQVIAGHVHRELPFMATERILMAAVAHGGDRQALHERIRVHSHEVAVKLKAGDTENDLLERLRSDSAFPANSVPAEISPRDFVGRAPQQLEEFLAQVVEPILRSYPQRFNSMESPHV